MVTQIQKKIHFVLASRRLRNYLCTILVDDATVEGVQQVHDVVYSHFAAHLKARNVVRPGVENLQFCALSYAEGGGLIKPFFVEEVNVAMWDYDSFKSPGPNDINLGFIKDFWLDLKDDLMRFVSEFLIMGS